MKSLFQLLKLKFHGRWATLFHTRFQLGSYSVPIPHGRKEIPRRSYTLVSSKTFSMSNLWKGSRGREAQNRQRAQRFLQSSELGIPHPFTRRQVFWFWGEGHSRLWERGWGSPNSTRYHIRHCGTQIKIIIVLLLLLLLDVLYGEKSGRLLLFIFDYITTINLNVYYYIIIIIIY
jgi:hypothetical protein